LCPCQPAGFRATDDRLCAGKWLIESKSLKLFLASFRNHGTFRGLHADDRSAPDGAGQTALAAHCGLLVSAWRIPIDVFWQTGKPRPACGYPNKVCRRIEGVVDRSLKGGQFQLPQRRSVVILAPLSSDSHTASN
jgi:hypothetical protein